MDISKPLPLLILSVLEAAQSGMTRYSIMIKLNHIHSVFDSPFSPGAIYHMIRKLLAHKMIINNQDNYSISALGRDALRDLVTTAPLPSAWSHLVYRIIAASALADQKIRLVGMRRIEIEMIKNNHNMNPHPISELDGTPAERALRICHSNAITALQKAILDIVAEK